MSLTEEEKNALDEKIKAMQEEKQKQETNNNLPAEKTEIPTQELAEFKPTYDKNKSMYENGKDFAKTMGIRDALEDDTFRQENKEKVKQNLRTDANTEQIKSEIEEQKQLYNKLAPVLRFARMEEPCDKKLMVITYGFSLIPYCLNMIISGLFNLIASFFAGLNVLFNNIFGSQEYLRDKDKKLILDDKGKPIPSGAKVNLLTKILFSVIIGFIGVLLICGIVNAFTGFDFIGFIKNAVTGA